MGYKYTVVWYHGSIITEARGTQNIFEAVWWLLTHTPEGPWVWRTLELR